MKYFILFSLVLLTMVSCVDEKPETEMTSEEKKTPFLWENANLYFLLTDRFNNGNEVNDINFERSEETAVLRGFEGGDILGITQKIESGYFDSLGINAIWFTPVVEQVRGVVDEGTGKTYGYHGYWAADWTSLDPNFGTEQELIDLVQAAHARGIRVLLDIVINHTGPVTKQDPAWPSTWVRTEPTCTHDSYEATTSCTLVENLPDILTSSNDPVELPPQLVEKWEKEGRLEAEMQELEAFFEKTGYPRAPRFYIIKWLVDMIEKYGVDGFRVDTAKHLEESVWTELYNEAVEAFARWKQSNPDKVLDDNEFYMVGEVYNYFISDSLYFDHGDKVVNYYDYGFKALINFDFKTDATGEYEAIFSKYSRFLNGPMKGKSVLNYITSHDDGSPFDKKREKPIEAGTKLLLTPGGVQVYYGDETMRTLEIEGTSGDATLRSFMNWDEIEQNAEKSGYKVRDVLNHWRKLGKFRNMHPSVGAGVHEMISSNPYVFKRSYESEAYQDKVVVALDMEVGSKTIPVGDVFQDGANLIDSYSGEISVVENGNVTFSTPYDIVLISE